MLGPASPAWSGAARADGQVSDSQMKAAFLLNFAKFVRWPPSTEPLVIGVAGDAALPARRRHANQFANLLSLAAK